MSIKDFIHEMMGENEKNTQICMLKDHTEIIFLMKTLRNVSNGIADEINALKDKHKEEKNATWTKIEKYLDENNLCKYYKDNEFRIKDEVLYLVEDK